MIPIRAGRRGQTIASDAMTDAHTGDSSEEAVSNFDHARPLSGLLPVVVDIETGG